MRTAPVSHGSTPRPARDACPSPATAQPEHESSAALRKEGEASTAPPGVQHALAVHGKDKVARASYPQQQQQKGLQLRRVGRLVLAVDADGEGGPM